MNTQSINTNQKRKNFSEQQCYVVLAVLVAPFLYTAMRLEDINKAAFHSLLFFTGWAVLTFFEYIAHRFWMHAKEKAHPGKSLQQHMYHHRHPTELKITSPMRIKLLIGNILLIAGAVLLNNYFTLFAGFYTGFVYYCFIHVFLHKPIAGKIFPGLQTSHIHHHCKYPDHCFGSCVTWWDKLFNTDVPWETKISERVRAFYFGRARLEEQHHY